MKILLATIILLASFPVFAQNATLEIYSVISTNWQTVTNYARAEVGNGTNHNAVVYFKRDRYLLGTVSSNTFASVIYDGRKVSTTLLESNILYTLKVTTHTNIFTKTNITKFK